MRLRKNIGIASASYVIAAIVFTVESVYFTNAKVGTLAPAGYDGYLEWTSIPMILLAGIGVIFAAKAYRRNETKTIAMVLFVIGASVVALMLTSWILGAVVNG